MTRLARGSEGTRKQSVSPRRTGDGDSTHIAAREREHDGNVLLQDGCRRCARRDVEAGKQHTCPEILNGHLRDIKRACDTPIGRYSITLFCVLGDWDCGVSGGEGGFEPPIQLLTV